MLDKLPPELFSQVLLDIDDIRDLWSLCLVCREAQGKATPKLYQTLVIRSNDETRLENVDVKQYAAAASRPTGSLRFVQDLRIVSPFTQVRERCPHFMPRTEPQTTKGKKKTGRKPAAWPFTKCLSPILWKLKPNTLKSFSWQLGACLTQELFDYLTTNQLKIESLNLVTDPKCRLMKLRLKKRSFDAIRLLSWKGLDARNHGKLLLCILAQHNETLDSLELEKSEIWRRNIDASHDLGDSLLLAPRPETDEVAYPNLQHLSLYRFSLTTFRVEGVRAAFNLSNLRSLRLRHCLQPDALFTHAVLKKQEIRLTDLEFNWVSRFTALDPPELHVRIANINIFLQAFHGLEHLLIFTDMGLISGKSAYPHDIFAQGIVSHRTSLKQLSSRCFATATSYEHFHTDFSTYGDKVVANVASATGQKASILNDLDLEALSITALPRDKASFTFQTAVPHEICQTCLVWPWISHVAAASGLRKASHPCLI